MRDIAVRYGMLCHSLGMSGFTRLRVIELRALKRPLAQALAFACVLSIGDFGAVALFGNEQFRTRRSICTSKLALIVAGMAPSLPCCCYCCAFTLYRD